MFKRFIKYYKPYKGLFIADMICSLVVCAVDLVFPQLLNILMKGVFSQEKSQIIQSIIYAGIFLFVLYFIRFCCQYFITSWGHIMGAKMESDMRQDLFTQYQRMSFSYYDRNNTGEMMSKLISDLFEITELAHHGPEAILISFLKIFGSFIILLTINVPLTFILLTVTLIMIVVSLLQNHRMRKIFADNRIKIATVNAGIQDSLAGIRVVQSFANEPIEEKKFYKCNQDFLVSKKKSYVIMGLYHAGNQFFQGLLYVAVLVGGGYFIYQGTLTPAELAVYALYIGIFINPIDVLLHFTEQFQKGFSGFKRFYEVVTALPEIVDRPQAKNIENIMGNVAYKNVTFSYDKTNKVLQDISLEIPAGKTIALVGASGGGKSTICSLLPRFYDINSGEITVDNIDIRDVKLKSLRSLIGIVQQDVYLFNGTIKDNILYGKPQASDEELINAAQKANIHDYIMSLPNGYNSYVGERGVRLSGGQKQRISIARVFLKNPVILILDEATSALDNESEQKIQQALEDLSKNRTTLIIAHRLSTIRHADKIIVIEQGKIAEQGTHKELIDKQNIYYKYYQNHIFS